VADNLVSLNDAHSVPLAPFLSDGSLNQVAVAAALKAQWQATPQLLPEQGAAAGCQVIKSYIWSPCIVRAASWMEPGLKFRFSSEWRGQEF